MSTPPEFDWPAMRALAETAHDVDDAKPWPPVLADTQRAWATPGTLMLCSHLADGPTVPLYGMAHEVHTIVCAPCLADWEERIGTPAPCQVCGRPAGRHRIDAGYLTMIAYLCPACMGHS